MIACPFCGAPETDRFELEGHRFLVFRCQFSPEVPRGLSEEETARAVARFGEGDGAGYFRRTCDRLHLYVTQGDGARHLAPPGGEAGSGAGGG